MNRKFCTDAVGSLNRRTVLRGLGAALSLPWLDSLHWSRARAAGLSGREADSIKAPIRWGCLLFANGVNPHQWWARGEGDGIELSPTLEPLAEFRRDITVIKDMHVFNNTSGPHWPLFSNYLNGAQFRQTLIPEGAESIDQVIARHAGRETSVPSLVLGVEPAETGLRGGVPSVYYGTISWSSRNTPIPPEIYPRAVFDRMFDVRGLKRDKSVLDAVLEQTADLQRSLAVRDRQKLDEFMHSVRDVEQRIERASREDRLEGRRAAVFPEPQPPPEELPQDVSDHMRMMLDLIVLAWRMDKTRVTTLIFNRDVSHMKFGFLEGVPNDQLHGISHHKENPEKLAGYQRINRFHVEQLAYLMRKLGAIEEGDEATLLDNSMVMFGSNMFDGDSHDGRNLPLVLAGHGGGTIAGGRVIDTGTMPEERQRLCNLHLALAKRMGVDLDRFGDSVEEMEGLN